MRNRFPAAEPKSISSGDPSGAVGYSRTIAAVEFGFRNVKVVCQRSPLPRFTVLRDADRAHLRSFFALLAERLMRVVVPGGHIFIATNPLVSHLAPAYAPPYFLSYGTLHSTSNRLPVRGSAIGAGAT